MIRACIVAVTLAASTLPASAQSTLERLEAVAVSMNSMIFEAMVNQTPALEGNMPSPEWSEDLRIAYTCMHDAYVAAVGEDAVADMVTAMEETLATTTPAELLDGGGGVENPAGLTDEQAIEIVGDCGMMEAFMAHMTNSGAMQILMEQ